LATPELNLYFNDMVLFLDGLSIQVIKMKRHNKEIVLVLILAGTLLPILPISASSSVTLTDDVGRTVSIAKRPMRIVSLAPSITEILFALGLGDRVVGVTSYCNYPPEVLEREAEGKITVVGGFTNPSLEKIADLNPDLVFGHNLLPPEFIHNLERINITVVVISTANSIDGIFDDIRLIGRACWEEESASKLITDLQEKISRLEAAVEGAEKVEAAHICWMEPIFIAGARTYVNDLIERAGGINVFSNKTGWATISKEELVKADPAHIIVPYKHGAEAIYNALMDLKEKGLIHGQIHTIDPDIISRPGPRVILALEKIVSFLHPEVWSKMLQVMDLTVQSSVTAGDSAAIFVEVKNTGELGGVKTISVVVDGKSLQKNVTLDSGESKLVVFTVMMKEAGVYTVSAGGKTATLKVNPAPSILIVNASIVISVISLVAVVVLAVALIKRTGTRR